VCPALLKIGGAEDIIAKTNKLVPNGKAGYNPAGQAGANGGLTGIWSSSLNLVERVFGNRQWGSWQIYLTATSSAVATLGIVFGVLNPLLAWLSGSRALWWSVSCLAGACVIFLFVRRTMNRTGAVTSSQYVVKLGVMAAVWVLFPYALCTGARIAGDITVACTCVKVPPTVSIEIQKFGPIVRIADARPIQELLRRTKALAPVTPVFHHPIEIETIVGNLHAQTASPEAQQLAHRWDEEEKMIATTLVRLVASFSSSPLPASELSNEYRDRMLFQARGSPGFAVLSGDQVQDYLKALMGRQITFEPLVDEKIIEASQKYLTLAFVNQYQMLQDTPMEYLKNVDPDFLEFLRALPTSFKERLISVAYPKYQGELLWFECGNEAKGVRRESHSRFAVEPEEVINKSTIEQMRSGPWPLGPPHNYFSDAWWLDHAIWQMLAREQGEWRDNLALRVGEFDVCGPP
jgi:hypothetical protein